MSAVVTPIRSAEAQQERFVTPVLVLLVGLLGIAIGFVAGRGFEAGVGTVMAILSMRMLRDEVRPR